MYVTQNIIFRIWKLPNPYSVCETSHPLRIPLNPLPTHTLSQRKLTPTDVTRLGDERALLVYIPKVSTTFYQWALRLFPYIEPKPIILLLSDVNTILWNHKANTIKTFFLQNVQFLFPYRQKHIFGGCYILGTCALNRRRWILASFPFFFTFFLLVGGGCRGLSQGHWSDGEARQPVW